MRIGVPQERLAQETRAAATPKTVEQLLKLGFSVAVESGAGKLASFDDEAFAEAGAEIVTGDEVWQSDVILKVNAPNDDEIALLNPGTTLISFIWPAQNPQLMEKLAARNINVMAMDSVPRISRASRWMRSAQWPTSPGTALSLKRRMNLVDSLPGRLRRQARFRPPR